MSLHRKIGWSHGAIVVLGVQATDRRVAVEDQQVLHTTQKGKRHPRLMHQAIDPALKTPGGREATNPGWGETGLLQVGDT
jgi:hypothetical protein